ncbi:MAG: Na+/H+ antiporter subunit E [Luteolibacter sp.]
MKELWKRTFFRLPGLLRFLPIYLREMTLSNIRVAMDALRPQPRFRPGFVEISLRGYDPIQRWEAACLISMTPGTLSLDLEEGSDMLLVHALYLDDPEQTRNELETLIRQSLGEPDFSPP